MHSLEVKAFSFGCKHFRLLVTEVRSGHGRMSEYLIEFFIGNNRRMFVRGINSLLNVGRVGITESANDLQNLRHRLFYGDLHNFHYVIVLFLG